MNGEWGLYSLCLAQFLIKGARWWETPVGGVSGTATLRALRSNFKPSRHVIRYRRPPKRRNSTRISLQPASPFCRWNRELSRVNVYCLVTRNAFHICRPYVPSAVIIKVGWWSWISWCKSLNEVTLEWWFADSYQIIIWYSILFNIEK